MDKSGIVQGVGGPLLSLLAVLCVGVVGVDWRLEVEQGQGQRQVS